MQLRVWRIEPSCHCTCHGTYYWGWCPAYMAPGTDPGRWINEINYLFSASFKLLLLAGKHFIPSRITCLATSNTTHANMRLILCWQL